MHVPSKVAGKIVDLVSDDNKNNYQSGLTGDIGLGCFRKGLLLFALTIPIDR